MLTPQRLADGSSTQYGLGLFPDEFRGARRIRHDGQTQGFVADYEHFPAEDVSVVTFANMYGANPRGVTRSSVLRAIPQLSYDQIAIPPDPNPARTLATRRALRQVFLNERPADLLSDEALGFATGAQFAEARAQLRVYGEHADEFVYLRSDPPNGDSERHIYKLTLAGETTYIAFTWRQGKVIGMQRMDE